MGFRSQNRRWLLIAGISLAVLVGVYFLLQELIVNAGLRPRLETALSKALSAPATIGSVRAGLTGNVVLKNLELTIPGNPWEIRLKVREASVNLGIWNLLVRRKPLEDSIEDVSLWEPSAILIRTDAPVSQTPQTVVVAPTPGTKVPIPLLPIPKIFVRNGSFSIQAGKNPRAILNQLEFSATNNGGQAWGLVLSAHSPEKESNGAIRFNGSLHLADLKVSGKVSLEKWPLVSAGSPLKDLSGWEIQSGTIDAEAPVVYRLMGGLWFDAKATLEGASVKSPEPSGVVFSNVTGRAFIRPTGLTVPGQLTFQIGETDWQASGSIPFDHRPLSVSTHTDKLFLADVFGEILKIKGLKVDGSGSADLTASGPLEDPVVTGVAQLGESHIGEGQLDSFSVKADYSKGQVNLDEITGKLYDGDFKASGTIPLAGMGDSPVSVTASLRNLEAEKIAELLGVEGMEGRSNAEVELGGTLAEPVFSATSQTTLTRVLRNTKVEYSLKNNIELRDQRLDIKSVLNDKTRLDCQLAERPEDWEIKKFSLVTGKKIHNFTVGGTWPKGGTGAVDMSFSGNDIDLENIPFFKDQFPDVKGVVNLKTQVGGTRDSLEFAVNLDSPGVQLGSSGAVPSQPNPMEVAFTWKKDQLQFDKLTVGDIFSMSGQLGFTPTSPLDLKIQAKEVPVGVLAEIGAWNNPPQPFQGSLTGKLFLSGIRKNPIFTGEASVDALKIGDWSADRLEASLGMEQGKVQVKKILATQGDRSLRVFGSWDTQTDPGTMNLRFSSDGFQLGHGPSLSGDFQLGAKTGEPWLKNWDGAFSSKEFTLVFPGDKKYKFSDFSSTASARGLVYQGKFQLGKSLSGAGTLDFSGSKPQAEAQFKIEPTLLSDEPELTQFFPADFDISGKVSGKIQLAKSDLGTLPLTGNFVIEDGRGHKYDFDRMELAFQGNKLRIAPKLTLTRGDAKYTLSGTFQSPVAFWDSDSKIAVDGPFQGEKLANILGLLGIDTTKHKVGGRVDGNLSVGGSFSKMSVGFSVTGKDLRFDNNLVPSAVLNFSETDGKVSLGENQVTLEKGKIQVDQGNFSLDPADPSLVLLNLTGSAEGVPVGPISLTGQAKLSGKLALEEKAGRPTFEGLISLGEKNNGETNSEPFDMNLSIHHQVIDFKPMDNSKTQLVGTVDISQDKKITVNNLHLVNSKGQFAVDGFLDLTGNSKFTCDARDIPIENVGRWFFPDFPLSGTGSYHMVFDGTLDNPIFTSSFSISDGKIGALDFDLLDGGLQGRENTLYLGGPEEPLTLSRQGLFNFTVSGKIPLALTHESWLKVSNQEMDVNAQMTKGDFSLILLAGLAQKASGATSFSAHVGGTLDDPVLNMDLDISKASMVPFSFAHSVDDINGRIKVRNNRMVVQDLNGRVGQGRVFISSPPIDETKMVLENFIPQYLDLSVKTIGNRGLYLNIPGIMDDSEWGEIQFYGSTREDPLLIVGPLSAPKVVGTAFLQSGHYTFPPKEKGGKTVTYNALGNVTFDLNLVSGNNAWYSNDFAGQYLELKIDPGDQITITGKDSDKTPDAPGINCIGSAGSKEGWLRYLGHEFKMQQAAIYMSKGKPPVMSGHATDRIQDADVITAGNARKTDVDIWVDFKGTFGNINFTLDSSPRFAANDPDASQKILLSYIMFGQDMTGLSTANRTAYTPEELQAAYQQKFGQAAGDAVLDALRRMGSNEVTKRIRPLAHDLAGVDVDFQMGEGLGSGPNSLPTPGVGQSGVDPNGNTLGAGQVSVFALHLRKALNSKLSVLTNLGLNRDLYDDKTGLQGQVGIQYDISKSLSLNAITGGRDDGQQETKVMAQISQPLPDIINPKKGDKDKPRFMRFDVYPVVPGKFHLVWETDKVTKGEIQVVNSDGRVVQDIPDKNEFAYDHVADIEGLNPEMEYKIQVVARDPNGNENGDIYKAEAASD